MRFRLGIVGCLLAGCASQPTAPGPTPGAELRAAMPPQTQVLRVGLEFLSPDDRFVEHGFGVDVQSTRVEAGRGKAPVAVALVRPERAEGIDEPPSRVPRLSRIDFAAIDDPIARETVHFLADLVETDRQRVRREVGIPFLDFRRDDAELGPLLHSEQRNLQDHEQWCQQHGIGLLRRPMRQLLKRLPLVHDLQVEVEDFRSENVPLSQDYQEAHGGRNRLGRMSVRVRANDLSDPVEVVYMHSGVRIGTSREQAKLSIDVELSPLMALSFRARNEYERGKVSVRSDLVFSPTARMSVHLAAGDDMDFLSTSSIYSLFESPMDGKPGLVLYAVHTF